MTTSIHLNHGEIALVFTINPTPDEPSGHMVVQKLDDHNSYTQSLAEALEKIRGNSGLIDITLFCPPEEVEEKCSVINKHLRNKNNEVINQMAWRNLQEISVKKGSHFKLEFKKGKLVIEESLPETAKEQSSTSPRASFWSTPAASNSSNAPTPPDPRSDSNSPTKNLL